MATVNNLISRVRVELGDLGKSFVTQFVADGSTNRFKLHYSPLDATTVSVAIKRISNGNNYDITANAHIEESTGVLSLLETDGTTPLVPADGDELTVSGTYYRYFTGAEVAQLVGDAFNQHSLNALDSTGRTITLENLPVNEEYPLTIYAVTLALYTLATDAAFDIDISAPDGVNIPRTERYRQLMEMIQTRQGQYRELCALMGIGLYRIEVFDLNRVSKMTNRLIPKYIPQEVDDRSYPQRVKLSAPTLGNNPTPWPTEAGELTAYQGRSWSYSFDFAGDYSAVSFVVKLLNQRGSVLIVQNVTLDVVDHQDGTYTANMSLTKDQTLRLAERTYWSLGTIDDTTGEAIEIKGGNFFTVRSSTVVL